MPKLSIDVAVERIASLGYDGLEISVLPAWTTAIDTLDAAERKRILKLVNDKGLTISAISGHASLLEKEQADNDRNLARLKAAIDLAVEWSQNGRIPYVNTLSGGRTADWDEQKQVFAERLLPAAEYAASQGVVLAMEPHVDGLVDTPQRMVEILEMVNSSALKVNFDISHFDILGMSTEESVSILAPYSVHTHVKDQRGRYPDYEFLTPGEGDFDYVEYLKAMQAHGYDGFINAEVSIMRQRKPDYDPLAACDLSYLTLSKAFEDAGIERK
jgi:sugar phosphate isomerase/epimerase